MPDPRKRMVVEEVGTEETPTEVPVTDEIKEKVEDLQTITEHIAEDVKQSAEVQEEIKVAVEKKQEEFVAPKQAPEFNPLIIIIPGILLLGALLGGFVFYQKSMNKAEPTPTPSPEVVETVNPTSSPVATTKTSLTKYSIAVQNGSGIAGEAGRAQTLVETAGFKVSGTGNADSYTYTKTVVKAKSTVEKDYLDALVSALSKTYTVDKTATLSATSKDDVQVIVGSLKSAK